MLEKHAKESRVIERLDKIGLYNYFNNLKVVFNVNVTIQGFERLWDLVNLNYLILLKVL